MPWPAPADEYTSFCTARSSVPDVFLQKIVLTKNTRMRTDGPQPLRCRFLEEENRLLAQRLPRELLEGGRDLRRGHHLHEAHQFKQV